MLVWEMLESPLNYQKMPHIAQQQPTLFMVQKAMKILTVADQREMQRSYEEKRTTFSVWEWVIKLF